jgi:hypothetical protein
VLYFGQTSDRQACILTNGQIRYGESTGSIHKVGREILKAPCNGWMAWYYIDEVSGKREPIDVLRKNLREEMSAQSSVSNDISGKDL